jgi:N utilization substance protein B
MLNRRHLRVKALQVLYSYQQSQVKEILPYEKALLQSVDKVYEMYIWLLSLLIEVADYSIIDAEERANKFLPSEEDLNASVKIQNNLFIASLKQNPEYLAAVKKYKISWDFDPEVRKSIFITLKASEEYNTFLGLTDHTIQKDKDIIKFIFKKLILKSPGIEQIFEEKFIEAFHNKYISQSHLITFAWEKESEAKSYLKQTIEAIKEVCNDTEYLVVIGYSFPFYNREIDKLIFETITPTLKKIYFQDPYNDGSFLIDRYNLQREPTEYETKRMEMYGALRIKGKTEVKHITETDQFYVPIEL